MSGVQVTECSFKSSEPFAWRVEWTRGEKNSVKWFTDGEEKKSLINTMDDLGWSITSIGIYQKTN